MNIISEEIFDNNEIYYSLKQDLLIPCYVYKIPIEVSRSKDLNFIEKTVLKLIKIDESLKGDTERLAKLVGFYNENKEKDKTPIVQLILDKLKDLRIDFDNEEEEENIDVVVYQFYQEAYTHKLLPIVTKELNSFSKPNKDYPFKEIDNFREITFSKGIDSKKDTKSILVKNFNVNPVFPSTSDIIETIYKHNQSTNKASHKIDCKNFNIELLKPELVFLHTKLYFLIDIESVVITNGFTNDFSSILRRVFSDEHSDLLKLLKQDTRKDVRAKPNKILIPFEKDIEKYKNIKNLIKNIEKNIPDITSGEKEVNSSKEKLTTNIYDLIEKLFERLSENIEDSVSLTNSKLLKSIAKEINFKIPKRDVAILKVSSRENLQKHLAKCLLYKKEELYKIALQFPNFLNDISILLLLRNGVKHADKEKTLSKVSIEELDQFKETAYQLVTIILKVKYLDIKQVDVGIDNQVLKNNALLDLEKDLSIDILEQLPKEVKQNLVEVNFYLNKEFKTETHVIVKEVINNLYSVFEFLLKKVVDVFDIVPTELPSKEDILSKIRNKMEVSESLYRVSPIMIEGALDKRNASLGAYVLVFLYYKEIDIGFVNLIEFILEKRKHGNPTIEETQSVSFKDLQKLKKDSFKHIEKLIAF